MVGRNYRFILLCGFTEFKKMIVTDYNILVVAYLIRNLISSAGYQAEGKWCDEEIVTFIRRKKTIGVSGFKE